MYVPTQGTLPAGLDVYFGTDRTLICLCPTLYFTLYIL